ncbi:MAG: cyclopropane-fatty-acyl-phospholipid synthase family protein [Pseudorhodobacter sp.]|nr:cyclopropane-fatty-acyl-phospholipid synthase family protein [Pseudorhodobacter sp.]
MWDRILDRLLRSLIRDGNLTVRMPGGVQKTYGDGSGPAVHVTLHDPALPGRLVRGPDLALGEAYMDQTLTIENDDLAGFLALLLHNAANGRADWWRYPLEHAQRVFRLLQQVTPAPRARRNVAHHYDLQGELYDLFLDPDRQYSCGYFKTPDDTLEQAQAQKKAHIAAKLRLAPGMRVLDIGCGWGGMALSLARDHGVQVLGITLSLEQHRIATARAAEAGLAGLVEFRLTDYRAVTGVFDRIVSVGMFEHVGVPQYRTYFRQVRDLLAPDGVALIHTIGRTTPPGITSPWITKYIFPGGYCPALSEMMPAIQGSGLGTTDIEVWRLHYAETLREWRKRFEANIDRAAALYDDRFCRMWRYYLTASEMTFRHYGQCVFQIQLAHRQDAVPLTRDYLYTA